MGRAATSLMGHIRTHTVQAKAQVPCYDARKAAAKSAAMEYGRAFNGNHGGKAGGTLA